MYKILHYVGMTETEAQWGKVKIPWTDSYQTNVLSLF